MHNNSIIINEPHDFDNFANVWNHYITYPATNAVKRIEVNHQNVTYYFIKIASLESIYYSLQNIYLMGIKYICKYNITSNVDKIKLNIGLYDHIETILLYIIPNYWKYNEVNGFCLP